VRGEVKSAGVDGIRWGGGSRAPWRCGGEHIQTQEAKMASLNEFAWPPQEDVQRILLFCYYCSIKNTVYKE
jgi:hypothetical protein